VLHFSLTHNFGVDTVDYYALQYASRRRKDRQGGLLPAALRRRDFFYTQFHLKEVHKPVHRAY